MFSALEVCYENALYKFTFDIDIDIDIDISIVHLCAIDTRLINATCLMFRMRRRLFGLVHSGNSFGEGTGEILLDDVNCLGNETSLADCQHGGWGEHNCAHHEDVSIKCVDNLDITGKH